MRDMNHWVAVRWVVCGLGPCSLLFAASPVVGSPGLSAGIDLSVVCPILLLQQVGRSYVSSKYGTSDGLHTFPVILCLTSILHLTLKPEATSAALEFVLLCIFWGCYPLWRRRSYLLLHSPARYYIEFESGGSSL